MSQINKPTDYFNTKLYSGTGSTQNITGVGFQPDFTWVKSRTSAEAHVLRDVVRGNFRLNTASTGAETDATSSISGFVSDGFTVATADAVNNASQTYASWNWLGANGTASNTDGEQSATVSANTTSGFSIIKWTGNASGAKSTVGHGLGVTPNVFITKRTDSTSSWIVYHSAMDTTGDYYLNLETNGAKASFTEVFGDGMTSSVCGLASFHTTGTYVGYAFAEKKGFSKFGSYRGNEQIGNSAPFIYTGFKPAWLMVKKYSAANHWIIWDNKRSTKNGFNIIDRKLYANLSNAENGADDVSFLSNGFKLNTNTGDWNELQDYIYMAFAEEPLVGDNPATAR